MIIVCVILAVQILLYVVDFVQKRGKRKGAPISGAPWMLAKCGYTYTMILRLRLVSVRRSALVLMARLAATVSTVRAHTLSARTHAATAAQRLAVIIVVAETVNIVQILYKLVG